MRTFIAVAILLACVYAQAPAPANGTAFNPTVDCAYYCNYIDSVAVRNVCGNATDMFSNFGYFGGLQGCLATCGAIASVNVSTPVGQLNLGGFIGNTSGNTMGCRLYHATAIVAFGSAHCPHATIHGGGVGACTNGATATAALQDTCATWCSLLGAACNETFTTATPGPASFDGTTCGVQCATAYGIPTSFTYPVSAGGDNLACHLYHSSASLTYLLAANESLRVAHCSHASPLGGGVCATATSPQRVFCGELSVNCAGSLYPYRDNANCLSDSANYSVAAIGSQFGAVNSTSGDTLACRFYHGGMPVKANATYHCPHAAWASATCGTRPSTAGPTTAMPTTTGSASTLAMSVLVVLAALLIAFF